VQLDRVAPRVAAEQSDLAAVLAQQAEQDADGRRLARTVRSQEGMHLAGANLEIEAVKRDHATISLGQPDRA
jgi:hypothetical protein